MIVGLEFQSQDNSQMPQKVALLQTANIPNTKRTKPTINPNFSLQ
jgi:hypothetical protein